VLKGGNLDAKPKGKLWFSTDTIRQVYDDTLKSKREYLYIMVNSCISPKDYLIVTQDLIDSINFLKVRIIVVRGVNKYSNQTTL